MLSNIILTEFFYQCVQLCAAFIAESRFDMNGGVCPGDLFAAFKHIFHNFCSQRSPGSIFNQGNFTVLEIALGQAMDVIAHERIKVCVVGRGCQYQLVVTEGICDCQRHVASCQIMNNNFRASIGTELVSQCFHGLLGVTIYRSVSDYDSLRFRLIGGPGIVQA